MSIVATARAYGAGCSPPDGSAPGGQRTVDAADPNPFTTVSFFRRLPAPTLRIANGKPGNPGCLRARCPSSRQENSPAPRLAVQDFRSMVAIFTLTQSRHHYALSAAGPSV